MEWRPGSTVFGPESLEYRLCWSEDAGWAEARTWDWDAEGPTRSTEGELFTSLLDMIAWFEALRSGDDPYDEIRALQAERDAAREALLELVGNHFASTPPGGHGE